MDVGLTEANQSPWPRPRLWLLVTGVCLIVAVFVTDVGELITGGAMSRP